MENEMIAHEAGEVSTNVDLNQIAADINAIKHQVKETIYISTCRIGEKLLQAKGAVGHGNWGKWLADNVDYSERTAQNIITIYKNFNNKEMKFFGTEPDPELLAELNQSQLLALTSIKDEDKRNAFMEEHKEELPDMSKRELEKAIKELEEEKAARAEAEEEIVKLRNELVNGNNEELDELQKKYDKLSGELEAAGRKAENLEAETLRYQNLFRSTREELKNLKENPVEKTIEVTVDNKEELEAKDRVIAEKDNALGVKAQELEEKHKELEEKEKELEEMRQRIEKLQKNTVKSKEEKKFVRHYENLIEELQNALNLLSQIEGESKKKYGVTIRRLMQQVLDNTKWAEEDA